MKIKYKLIVCALLFCSAAVFAQTGNTQQDPIILGTYSSNFNYTDTQNTANFLKFTNIYTSPLKLVQTRDVYYRFTLNTPMLVTINHCGSALNDTFLFLLDASGNLITHNDVATTNLSGCHLNTHSHIQRQLNAGTYFVVSEGKSSDGSITTNITGVATGNTQAKPINAGNFSKSFACPYTVNTHNYTNEYTNPHRGVQTNDVYCQFTLLTTMEVTISHCGSVLGDTFLFLLHADGTLIDYQGGGISTNVSGCNSGGHAYLKKVLPAGTYFVVSEGDRQNVEIKTTISGVVSEFGYTEFPDIQSSSAQVVGSVGGVFDVSATGAATYSIPIEVPLGVNGMQPNIAIAYNSQAGNGIVGWGTNIAGISAITRIPKSIYYDGSAKGITHDSSDALMLDGQRLIPVSSSTTITNGTIYNTENDPFTTITCKGNYFEVVTKDSMKYTYGYTPDSKQTYSSSKVNAWYLNEVRDVFGNKMTYVYEKEVNNYFIYLKSISYGIPNTLNNTVTFNYGTRTDVIPFKLENISGSINRRLESITTKTGNNDFREYTLNYDFDKFSRLSSVTEKNGAGETLNPTRLDWDYLPEIGSKIAKTPTVHTTYMDFDKQSYVAIDLDGDGLDDLVGIYPYEYCVSNGMGGTQCSGATTKARVYLASRHTTTDDIIFRPSREFDLGSNFSVNKWKEQKGSCTALDFDGNGIKELMIPTLIVISGPSLPTPIRRVAFTFYESDKKPYEFTRELTRSSQMPLYATGDFLNNGKGQVICIEKGHSNNKYPGEIIGLEQGTTLKRIPFELTLPGIPRQIFAADFNGNGMTDIIVVHYNGYTVFWNQNGTFSDNYKKEITDKNTLFYLDDQYNTPVTMNQMGDFNGDGLPDFLTSFSHDWYFLLNNGDGTFSKKLAYTFDTQIYNQLFTDKDDDKFSCLVYDFDFDGKSDVVITKAVYEKKEGFFGFSVSYKQNHTYWLRSNGASLDSVKHTTSTREDDALAKYFVLGDFDGDGRPELMNYGYNCWNGGGNTAWRMYQNRYLTANSGMIFSIRDGLNITNITYSHLTDNSIYTKSNGSTYPLVDIQPALPVVKSVTSTNGVASDWTTTNYTYEEARAHLTGKGFLGFKKITANNTTFGVKTETGVTSLHPTFFAPTETYTKTTADNKTAQTNVKYDYFNMGNKKYCVQKITNTETDIFNNTVTTVYDYETTNGNITQEKTTFGNDNNYRTIDYNNYVQAGGTRPNKPELITVTQKHSDDTDNAQGFINKTSFTYSINKGLLIKKTENDGTTFTIETSYGYDASGNVTQEAVYPTGAMPINRNIEYDATNRFVTKITTQNTVPSATPISTMSYTYDIWGNLLTEKDETNPANILTTTHTYNNWGQKTKTTLPDGRKTTYTRGWGSTADKKYFTVTQGTGQPWVKTWYDAAGRETEIETIGAKDISIKVTNTYNAKGQLTQTVNQQGSLTLTDKYEYDALGRLSKETKGSGQIINYAYGNRSVTTTTNGHAYTKTVDAWGNVKTATDPGGTVAYTYYSNGKPKNITAAGASTSMTYNAIGQQTSLTDPNAGTTTYEYNLLGQLKKQTDANGKITQNFYDNLNRLSYSTLSGEQTTYYTYGTSGNNNLRLTEIKKGNMSIKYNYDSYGDLYSEERLMDNARIFYVQYQRDAQTKKTAPYFYNPDNGAATGAGNFYNKSIYDAYGNLVKKEATIHTPSLTPTSATVWELTGNTGTQITAKVGGTMDATTTYDSKGFLSNQKTTKGSTTLFNMSYTFSPTTGNLTNRQGMTNQQESFYYDYLDRLTYFNAPGVSYSLGVSYEDNGNISAKSGVGAYDYESSKPHAVTWIENAGNWISIEEQKITYNAFNKVQKITEKVGNDNFELNIIYGPDQQRWKSELKKNGNPIKTIIFAPDYERVTYQNGTTNTTKHFYYIYAGDGLAAIGVNENGQSTKTYYAHKDHLGSIVKLTDKDGIEVFAATYDAWGKQTLTNPNPTFAFHRGYTGHEHLTEFGLINMNGRMYDPLLGRMLSPDKYVANSFYSQDFNRYSYARNNPLRYTDPSGDFIFSALSALFCPPLLPAAMQLDMAMISSGGFEAVKGGNFWAGAGKGMITGTMNAGLSFINIPGMFPSGLFRAGTNVLTNGITNTLYGQNFFRGWELQAGTGFLLGAYSGYQLAKGRGLNIWTGKFDYQGALDNAVLQEGINDPSARWLVANRKNARVLNNTYEGLNVSVTYDKIYFPGDAVEALNIGIEYEGNITLVAKQTIRNKGHLSLTDIVRHERTHQLQTFLPEMPVRTDEIAAYMTNIMNPATNTTIQKVSNILIYRWGVNPSTLWETILNLYPYGPIP